MQYTNISCYSKYSLLATSRQFLHLEHFQFLFPFFLWPIINIDTFPFLKYPVTHFSCFLPHIYTALPALLTQTLHQQSTQTCTTLWASLHTPISTLKILPTLFLYFSHTTDCLNFLFVRNATEKQWLKLLSSRIYLFNNSYQNKMPREYHSSFDAQAFWNCSNTPLYFYSYPKDI